MRKNAHTLTDVCEASSTFIRKRVFSTYWNLRRSYSFSDQRQSSRFASNHSFETNESSDYLNKLRISMFITLLTQFQIIDRNARSFCIHCVVTNNRVFRVCRQIKAQSETCDECWWKHKASKCSLSMFFSFSSSHSKRVKRLLIYDVDSMRVEFVIAKMMLSIFFKIKSFFVHDRNTRARINVVKTTLSNFETCFSQRQSNRQRLFINQFTTSRERLQKVDFNVDKNESLFLFQNENEFMNMSTKTHSEHDDNFDDFEFENFEVERFDFIESQIVVFASIEKTEISNFRSTEASTIWVSRSRRFRVAKKIVNVFSREVWREFISLIYKRKYQTMLNENEKKMLKIVLTKRIKQKKMYETLTKTSFSNIQMKNVESNDENEK